MPNFDINDPKRKTRTQWHTKDSNLRSTPNSSAKRLPQSPQPANIPDFKEPPKNSPNPKTLSFANSPRPTVDIKPNPPKGLNLKPPPVIGKVLGELWRRGGGIVMPAASPLATAPVLVGGFLGGTEIGSKIYEDASTPNSLTVKTFDFFQGIRNPFSDSAGTKVKSEQGEVSPRIVQPEVPANFQGGQNTNQDYFIKFTITFYSPSVNLEGIAPQRIVAGAVGWEGRIDRYKGAFSQLTHEIVSDGSNSDIARIIIATSAINNNSSMALSWTGDVGTGVGSGKPFPYRRMTISNMRLERSDGTSIQNDIIQGGNPPPQQPEQVLQPQTLEPPRIQVEIDLGYTGQFAAPPIPMQGKIKPAPKPVVLSPNIPSPEEGDIEDDTIIAPSFEKIPKPNTIPDSGWIPSPNTGTNPDPSTNPNINPSQIPQKFPNQSPQSTPSPSPSPSPSSSPTSSPSPTSVTQPEQTTTGGQTTTQTFPELLPFTPPIVNSTPKPKPKEDPLKVGYPPELDDGGCCLPLGLGQQQIQQKQNTVLDKLDGLGQAIDLSLLVKIDATTLRTEGKVDAVNTKADTINTKLGNQLPNGGLSGFLTRAFQATRIDKVLNGLNTLLILHNALLLSQNIGSTLGMVLSQGLSALGIKDENGDPLDINATINQSVTNFIKGLVGEDLYNAVNENFKKANAIYTASINVLDNVTNMMDTLANGMELVGQYNAKIGNALKTGGQVFDNAYEWMDENINIHFGRLGKLDKIINGLNEIEEVSSNFEEITSNVVEFQESITELEESKQEFKETWEANQLLKKEEQDASKEASKPPTIQDSDLTRPEDDD